MSKQDDFIIIESTFFGSVNVKISKLWISWPPPEFLVMTEEGEVREATKDDDKNHLLYRVRMSKLTDEQIDKCPDVARGAEYKYVQSAKEGTQHESH